MGRDCGLYAWAVPTGFRAHGVSYALGSYDEGAIAAVGPARTLDLVHLCAGSCNRRDLGSMPSRTRSAVLLLVALSMVVLWPASGPKTDVDAPAWISTHAYTSLFKRQATLILLPCGQLGNSMLWQAPSGYYFRMAGGYTTLVPRSFDHIPAMEMFFGAPPVHNCRSDILEFCQQHHVVAIVVNRSLDPQSSTRMTTLDWRSMSVGSTSIFGCLPNTSEPDETAPRVTALSRSW
jgi:hypothetical protein